MTGSDTEKINLEHNTEILGISLRGCAMAQLVEH